MIRIGTAAPPIKWNTVNNRFPEHVSRCIKWLEGLVILTQLRSRGIQAITSLHLGLDTEFAKICFNLEIPYTVVLSCNDQDKFWDAENQKIFKFLSEKANEVIFATNEEYKPGCINIQDEIITNWLIEDYSRLFLVKNRNLSKNQRKRKKEVEKQNGRVDVFNFPRYRYGGRGRNY